ncbi:hypothetical protein RBWH47_05810 [Rhodopirellula baltica WH47]|uniref:Uncharacterized protein n=1 Tax=Rhodopirellula baltica WH47 TaxID=991778 RepID=F2AZ75_RHOBT|nr:hypothetical protein RBWH47_05810 [Rhodopirellula baltica WH47]
MQQTSANSSPLTCGETKRFRVGMHSYRRRASVGYRQYGNRVPDRGLLSATGVAKALATNDEKLADTLWRPSVTAPR